MTSQYKTTKLSTNTKSTFQGKSASRDDMWRPETVSLTREEVRAIVLRTLG